MHAFQWLRAMLAFLLLLASSLSVFAHSDITHRDPQALRGVRAVVLLEPEIDDAASAAGVTPELVARRTTLYLRDIGVQVLAGEPTGSADRGETPSVLMQFGVWKDERGRSSTAITLNVLRESGAQAQPIYIVQQRGLTRHHVTRNFLMRELDLALNMLREDLRRVHR
ncbi:hypothetical protein [Diaphorobacter aerolatus]|uniref:DUF4410 domain-containing protein n=1 Tax=Diaphorobacter aerolatus TaxID=1288495 RepID=A0A7H0GFV7_9BURK|nr:hypothetical protein [Diaphorobacter aerolatus]QNP47173.1 hypothetical protein H9K75_12210 [Diaphorobacter aerolatus]